MSNKDSKTANRAAAIIAADRAEAQTEAITEQAQGEATDDSKPITTITDEHRAEATKVAEAILAAIDDNSLLAALADAAKLHRRASRPATETQVTVREDGTKLVGATTTIKCIDCGKEHIVKLQDSFQVQRCTACQKKHRNEHRADKRKAKRAVVKAAKQADADLAAKLLADYKAKEQAASATTPVANQA